MQDRDRAQHSEESGGLHRKWVDKLRKTNGMSHVVQDEASAWKVGKSIKYLKMTKIVGRENKTGREEDKDKNNNGMSDEMVRTVKPLCKADRKREIALHEAGKQSHHLVKTTGK